MRWHRSLLGSRKLDARKEANPRRMGVFAICVKTDSAADGHALAGLMCSGYLALAAFHAASALAMFATGSLLHSRAARVLARR